MSAEIAQEWGRLNVPDPLPVVDGLLAATAKVHGWTLVTRNTRDLARTGVRLLDPFEAAAERARRRPPLTRRRSPARPSPARPSPADPHE